MALRTSVLLCGAVVVATSGSVSCPDAVPSPGDSCARAPRLLRHCPYEVDVSNCEDVGVICGAGTTCQTRFKCHRSATWKAGLYLCRSPLVSHSGCPQALPTAGHPCVQQKPTSLSCMVAVNDYDDDAHTCASSCGPTGTSCVVMVDCVESTWTHALVMCDTYSPPSSTPSISVVATASDPAGFDTTAIITTSSSSWLGTLPAVHEEPTIRRPPSPHTEPQSPHLIITTRPVVTTSPARAPHYCPHSAVPTEHELCMTPRAMYIDFVDFTECAPGCTVTQVCKLFLVCKKRTMRWERSKTRCVQWWAAGGILSRRGRKKSDKKGD